MIGTLISCVASKLNRYVATQESLPEGLERFYIANNLSSERTNTPETKGTVGLTAFGIKQDEMLSNQLSSFPDQGVSMSRPPRGVEFFIVFSTSPDDHSEGSWNSVMSVFQFFDRQHLWSRRNFPELPPVIETVRFENEPVTLEQGSQLWSMLGASYRPSIVYRVRLSLVVSQDVAPPVSTEIDGVREAQGDSSLDGA